MKSLATGWASAPTRQNRQLAWPACPTDSHPADASCAPSPSPTSDLKPFTARLADYLVLAKVRQALGFARCRKNFYGAAPMTADTQHYFLGLNIRLYSGYGLSETSGPHFMSSPCNYRLYRCGPAGRLPDAGGAGRWGGRCSPCLRPRRLLPTGSPPNLSAALPGGSQSPIKLRGAGEGTAPHCG